MTAGSRGAKQAREKRAVPECSELSSLVGVCGISFPTGMKLFRRVDCQKRSSASWKGEEFEGKGDVFVFLDAA